MFIRLMQLQSNEFKIKSMDLLAKIDQSFMKFIIMIIINVFLLKIIFNLFLSLLRMKIK